MLKTQQKINKTTFGSLALRGYDPVAYFTEGKAVEGRKEFTHEYADANWRFASAANRDLFASNPGKYAPQFGGYCAWAVSKNSTAKIEPDAFQVVDGRLLLQYDKSIRDRFNKDTAGNLSKADANWPGLVAKKGK